MAIPTSFNRELEAVAEKVKSMMEKSDNMIPAGGQQTTAFICKVCGKEDPPTNIKNHIEMNNLEGIPIPCSFCEKVCSSTQALRRHKWSNHKNMM